ncbi:TIGR02391 family protein [Variovorax sp. V118]|uniref:TIGR02391 family protein n=1 Tax=Variovorax sp. V118 TaxID=3065954 RepID=UPI0034E891C4
MNRLPCFEASVLQAVCRVLGDTNEGLTGQEIGYVLTDMGIEDPSADETKWKRIFNALVLQQNKHQFGNHVILFVNRAMAPARFIQKPQQFRHMQDGLNVALSLASYGVNDQGKVIRTASETTLSGAVARARRLKSILEDRGTHPQIFAYCTAELLAENYFHAVLEAVKSVAERLRQISGLTIDGAELVNQALSTKSPIVALNNLITDTEVSEQKGISNLLLGLFGSIRNPTAHAPKVTWPMPEQDALDIFALVSFVHRKLDGARKV